MFRIPLCCSPWRDSNRKSSHGSQRCHKLAHLLGKRQIKLNIHHWGYFSSRLLVFFLVVLSFHSMDVMWMPVTTFPPETVLWKLVNLLSMKWRLTFFLFTHKLKLKENGCWRMILEKISCVLLCPWRLRVRFNALCWSLFEIKFKTLDEANQNKSHRLFIINLHSCGRSRNLDLKVRLLD